MLSFQARAQAVMKQLNEAWDQIDQNSLALSTFNFLAEKENSAIPRRTEVLLTLITIFLKYCNP